jgi:hypothetical protein
MLLLALSRAGRAEIMPLMVENHQSEAQIVVFPHQSRGASFGGALRMNSMLFDRGHRNEPGRPTVRRIGRELVEI